MNVRTAIRKCLMVPLVVTMVLLNTSCEDSSESDDEVIVTQAECDQINDGETYEQVVAIIGSEGTDTGGGNYKWELMGHTS